MPRKKKGSKAKPPPTPHMRRRFAQASRRDDSPPARPPGYTLAEEARNTASNRRGNRGQDARLRYQSVTFISAGFMDPLEDSMFPKQAAPSVQTELSTTNFDVGGDSAPTPQGSAESSIQSQAIDCVAHSRLAQPQSEQPSDRLDVSSDSSEEVILFKGRNVSQGRSKTSSCTSINDQDTGKDVTVKRKTGPGLRFPKENTVIINTLDPALRAEELDFIPMNMKQGKRPPPHTWHPNTDSDDEEAAIIADYIANMQVDLDDSDENEKDAEHPFSILRDLGGTDSDAIPSQPYSGDESGDEFDDEADEVGAAEKPNAELEDERLAQLISTHEGINFRDNDVLLFDDADASEGWIAATSTPRRKKKGSSRKSRMFQGGSQFPSATKMAEAFDELDLVDMQNARLHGSKRSGMSLGLLDPELEDALEVAIKKDRLKKADKKKAREELRSQGLLGKNVNPHDLRVKYQGGMSLDDLAEEVEAFILGTQEQLILPPFDKGARRIVHTLANTFNIKSKSAGTGVGRYTVLYRTKATLPHDDVLLERAFSRVRRTWFPRVDVDGSVVQQTRILKRTETRAGKPRTSKWSLTLREGDIVGQHASEIGVDNKGRAMLEKMGWSKGMSLGTVETEGITVPIMHVIKKNKAGLGDI